jgi:Protein of unknown function (DUF3810)
VRLLVERTYSLHLYPAIQGVLTRASNLTSFAWLDAGLLIVPAALFIMTCNDVRRRGWIRGLARGAVRVFITALAVALAFVLTWGLNYQRMPMAERVRYDAAAVTTDAVRRIAATAVVESNRLHDAAHAVGSSDVPIDPVLAAGFSRALGDLGLPTGIVAGRPKGTLLDWYFRRAGVSGMTDPVFLETLVASDLLPFERPFVVAHEWSHLAGIADEGDANFAGWLTCLRGSAADRYSGWLFLYGEFAASLGREDRAAVAAKLEPGPREDLRAIRDRNARQVSPRVSSAGWRVYDSYLKANRVESGAASYAHVVRLVAGTTFSAEWRPELR